MPYRVARQLRRGTIAQHNTVYNSTIQQNRKLFYAKTIIYCKNFVYLHFGK